jgi:hypothetical protein
MDSNHPEPGAVASSDRPVAKTCALARASFYLGGASFLLIGILVFLVRFYPRPTILLPVVVLLLAWFFASLAAVIVGFQARNLIRADAALSGTGYAWAGALMGCANLILILVGIALPVLYHPHPHRSQNACINNLRQLDGAKEQWALENKKTSTDTPTFADLIGTDKYIKTMPACPANGTYTLNDMVHKPVCSITDHTLP